MSDIGQSEISYFNIVVCVEEKVLRGGVVMKLKVMSDDVMKQIHLWFQVSMYDFVMMAVFNTGDDLLTKGTKRNSIHSFKERKT